MAAAVSQLCVWQGSTLLDCFIQGKGCKVEQISPLFTYIFTYFSSSEEHPFCSMPTWHAKYCTDIYTEYGSRLMAKEEKSTFQISSLLLSSFISNIYTPEKGYYWKNQLSNLKIKGYQEVNSNVKQLLHREKILSTSIELESSKSMSVNVRESNFDEEVRVTWILVRTSTEPQGGQHEDQREH